MFEVPITSWTSALVVRCALNLVVYAEYDSLPDHVQSVGLLPETKQYEVLRAAFLGGRHLCERFWPQASTMIVGLRRQNEAFGGHQPERGLWWPPTRSNLSLVWLAVLMSSLAHRFSDLLQSCALFAPLPSKLLSSHCERSTGGRRCRQKTRLSEHTSLIRVTVRRYPGHFCALNFTPSTRLDSEERPEHSGPCPFCFAEAFQLRPDNPSYGSASSTTGRIPGTENVSTSLDDIGGCSIGDSSWWMDQLVNSSLCLEGAAQTQSSSTLHESVSIEISSTDDTQLEQFFDFDLLAAPMDEPRSLSPPGISQFVNDGFGLASQPQLSQQDHEIELQYPNLFDLDAQDSRQSPSSASLSATSLTRSTSPSTSSHASDDAPQLGRVMIPVIAKALLCSTCNDSFSSELRYRHHIRRNACVARQSFKCHACERSFTLAKDLNRHQRSAKSCPAASSQLSTGRYTCTCGKSYTRRDTLLRHFERANKSDGDNIHRFPAK
ncbi:hypothetical protein BDV96DRAFT_672314 [Lophiotrema nucula]|uniref:C2H2-type domain-containing protein n=1 Tax=Lophiotrema nucula TaxID=690887 RepID=A0A6A5YNB9_9PLEO|nr:hypothetical protein BDV96DRAFT_672314 [Lophiotrema nucula]